MTDSARDNAVDDARSSALIVRNAEADTPGWLYVLSWELSHIGGVNEVVRNLFERTARRLHHRPILFVCSWNRDKRATETEDGRLTIRAAMRSPWDPRRPLTNVLAYATSLPAVLWRLLRTVRTHRITTIHVHFPDLHALTWLLVRKLSRRSTRLVLSFHGLDLTWALRSRGIGKSAWRVLLRNADRIIVCSQDLQLKLINSFPGLENRLIVINNGVDVSKVVRARDEAPHTPVPASFLMSIGTYERKKGHDILMQAFDRVAARFPAISLVILGRGGTEDYLSLLSLRGTLSARDRIFLLQEVVHAEAMRLLARAEAFVLASREEPFGIVLLEAGALSLPVIATNVCGAAMLCAPDEMLLVPPGNVEALADALVRVLHDRQFGDDLGCKLHIRVVADFHWEKVMDRYVDLLPDASGGERRQSGCQA